MSLAPGKGEQGDSWRGGVEHGELVGLKEGVERFGVYEARVRRAIVGELSNIVTFMGSTKGAVPEGVSPRPSGSKDF